MNERTEDLVMVEVDRFIEKTIKEYYESHLGDRIGEVENAENIYNQEGRRAEQVSGEVGNLDQLIAGG